MHLKDWLEDVKKYASEEPLVMVLGNKSDLVDKKQVFDSDIKVRLSLNVGFLINYKLRSV